MVRPQRFLHRLLNSYGVTEWRNHTRAVKLDISVVENPTHRWVTGSTSSGNAVFGNRAAAYRKDGVAGRFRRRVKGFRENRQ